jgi:hypothetical protein
MLLTQLLTNFIDISVGNFAEVLAGSSMMLEQRSLPTASQNDTGMKTIPDQSSKGSGQVASPKNAAVEGSSSGKKAFQMKIPCSARSMPPEHPHGSSMIDWIHYQCVYLSFCLFRTRTSYSPKHGDDLICSFPASHDSGVKFCFYLCCRISVSKRNFRRLHHHRDQISELKKIASSTKTLPKKKRILLTMPFNYGSL